MTQVETFEWADVWTPNNKNTCRKVAKIAMRRAGCKMLSFKKVAHKKHGFIWYATGEKKCT